MYFELASQRLETKTWKLKPNMATLYRKYRPQNFKEVIGQNHIKITLQHEIESNKIAHAYLFCGPRAVGKTTVARVMAKAINCPKKRASKSEPCNECEACKAITAGKSMDIIEVDAASYTGVDNVRENIIANARIAPSAYKHKVFIIDEVHMLSTPAFNALLKIIEEPPEFVVFILCTTEVHKVPNTIISRCQRFDFKRISIVEIANKLEMIANKEGIKIEKNILDAIARQSEGHMRDAESLLGQVIAIGEKEITAEEADLVIPRSDIAEVINLIDYLKNKDAGSAIALINRMIDEGVNLKMFISDLIEILRKIMLAKINPTLSEKLSLSLGENFEAKIGQASSDLDLSQVILYIEKFIEARDELKGSFIIQLPIEITIAGLCNSQPADSPRTPISLKATAPAALEQKNPESVKPQLPSRPANSGEDINLKAVLDKWNEVLVKIKKHNHSLSFILRVCRPQDVRGNQICLAFKYKFHKDKIGETSIKPLVENVLREVYGIPLTIEAVIDENLDVNNSGISNNFSAAQGREEQPPSETENDNKKNKNEENLVDNLLKTFGGKVVN
ncbi:MAG: DNA polymerase III subunit gamma/tau [Patescibacteria group bacterium]|nr:DNA polymerase III subunit gamma/tau [Patescibacteria group bacterium]